MILNNAAAARIGARQVSRIYRGINEAWPGWTPARLFADGQQGVWYEPKPEYLFQDAAGTTPVTADGDPVGYMQDLSGNNNHATQATSAARPVYPGLAYDGVDDFLDITAVAQAATGTMSVFALIKRAVTDNVIYIASDTTARFTFIAVAGSDVTAAGDGMGGPIIRIDGVTRPTRGQVHDATSDLGWHLWEAEGLDVSTMPVLYIGNYAAGGAKPNGDVADFIFVDESQPIDRDKVRQHLADKKGITL